MMYKMEKSDIPEVIRAIDNNDICSPSFNYTQIFLCEHIILFWVNQGSSENGIPVKKSKLSGPPPVGFFSFFCCFYIFMAVTYNGSAQGIDVPFSLKETGFPDGSAFNLIEKSTSLTKVFPKFYHWRY